jgi:hypothetical protein
MDNAGYTYKGKGGYEKFTGTFTVPSNPKDGSKPVVLFYFIGLEDTWNVPNKYLNILQPVLDWGNHGRNAGDWGLSSWSCCPSNITTHGSWIKGLRTGDTIKGSIERTGSSSWSVKGTVNGQTASLNPRCGSQPYNWADVTLEIYDIKNCDEYSSGTVSFTDLQLTGSGGNAVTPTWGHPKATECGGTTVVHDPTYIDIYHNGGSPSPSPSRRRSPTPVPTPIPTPVPTPTPTPSVCGNCRVCFNPTNQKCQDGGPRRPKTKVDCEAKGHIWCGPSASEEYV